MLTRVTITGADDAVEPRALVDLSAEFPFVEWGILFSASRMGPRYPSIGWVKRFVAAMQLLDAPNLAAHFCGAFTRRTLEGDPMYLREVIAFDRIQLNGFEPSDAFLEATKRDIAFARESFILQVRDLAEMPAALAFAKKMHGWPPEVLFDPSGGRGLEPKAWATGAADIAVGCAGGITPDNVHHVIHAIAECRHGATPNPPYWIDMESGVRTDDHLDLAKVRAVLERAKGYVEKAV